MGRHGHHVARNPTRLPPRQHVWHRCPEKCTGCMYCNGGLSLCTVCGGAEVELPTECPGVMMTEQQRTDVGTGRLNYLGGRWQRSPHN